MNGERQRYRLIGIAAVTFTMVLTVVIFSGVFRAPFEGASRTVTVDFTKAAQLHKGDQVRLEGNVEGKVTGIEPSPRPEDARITLEVDDDAGPIYANAEATLSAKTLLGGAFYVALDRGTKNAGPLGDRVITSDHTKVQVEVEDLTTIWHGDAVKGFQTLPGEFATALANPDPPAQALKTVNEIADEAGIAVKALRGQKPGEDLPKLVAATSKTVKALDSDNDSLQTLVSGAAATLQVTGRRSAEIRQTIDSGPAVTSDLTQTLARLDGTLDIAQGLIARLQGPAPDVEPTLSALRPTLATTARTLDGAQSTVAEFTKTLLSVGVTGRAGVPVLADLQPGLKNIDEKILPYLGRKDPDTGMSTTVMIGGTAAGFGGGSGQQDGNGHFIRFPASIGTSSPSLYLPCSTSLVDPTAAALLACDKLSDAFTQYLKYLPTLTPQVPPAKGSAAK